MGSTVLNKFVVVVLSIVVVVFKPGGGDSHINVTGMLVGKFKFKFPEGNQRGCGSGFN